VYSCAKHITVQSLGVKERLIARDMLEAKVSVIFNWCDEASIVNELTSMKKLNHSNQNSIPSSTFEVLFAGNIGEAQDMDAILEAVLLLKIETRSIRLLLLGGHRSSAAKKSAKDQKKLMSHSFCGFLWQRHVPSLCAPTFYWYI